MSIKETVTFCLAIYASILATWNSVWTYVRDRRQVKISFARETEYIEEGDYRGVGETYTLVKVLNKSRRPVTITDVRARLLKGGWVTLQCKPPVPVELTDDQYITAVAGDEELDLNDVAVFEAHRAIGRPYRKAVAPWLTRLCWRLKARRKKKPKSEYVVLIGRDLGTKTGHLNQFTIGCRFGKYTKKFSVPSV